MSEASLPDFENLSTAAELRVNALCERFEEAWLRGARPAIASVLDEEPDPCARWVLLRELIQLDIFHRCRTREVPRVEDYLAHFAEFGMAWLGDIIRAATTSNTP